METWTNNIKYEMLGICSSNIENAVDTRGHKAALVKEQCRLDMKSTNFHRINGNVKTPIRENPNSCICVYMYACMHVWVHECMFSVYTCMHACTYGCMNASSMCVYMRACIRLLAYPDLHTVSNKRQLDNKFEVPYRATSDPSLHKTVLVSISCWAPLGSLTELQHTRQILQQITFYCIITIIIIIISFITIIITMCKVPYIRGQPIYRRVHSV